MCGYICLPDGMGGKEDQEQKREKQSAYIVFYMQPLPHQMLRIDVAFGVSNGVPNARSSPREFPTSSNPAKVPFVFHPPLSLPIIELLFHVLRVSELGFIVCNDGLCLHTKSHHRLCRFSYFEPTESAAVVPKSNVVRRMVGRAIT